MTRSVIVLSAISFIFCLTSALAGDIPFLTDRAEIKLRLQSAIEVDQVLTIDAGQDLGPMENRNGFIHGLDGGDTLSDSMVTFLKPRYWRLFKPESYTEAMAHGANITLGPSNHYAWYKGGWEHAKPWLEWEEYENYILAILQAFESVYPDYPPRYLDVWSEPDHSYFWHGTYEQLVETFARTIAVFRSHDPSIKIVGPSISWYRPGGYGEENIIELLADLDSIHGLRLDAISWHENGGLPSYGPGRPEDIYFDTESIRSAVEAYFPPDYTPEYHVNEYSGGRVHLSPGWTLAYLFWLDYMDIDFNAHACWGILEGEPPNYDYYSDCWSGFNGLFLRDGVTPQPTYWVHRAHAEMEGLTRLPVGTTSAHFLPMAVRNGSAETIRILAGRYYDSTSTGVALQILDYPYGHQHVLIDVSRIPSFAQFHWNPPIAMAWPDGPIDEGTVSASVIRGELDFVFEEWNPGDVYILDIRPMVCGDCDGSGDINIADVMHLVAYIFDGAEPPLPPAAGDTDCSGVFNVLDVVNSIEHVFRAGPEPCNQCP